MGVARDDERMTTNEIAAVTRAVARVAFLVCDNEDLRCDDMIRLVHAIKEGDDMSVGLPEYSAIAAALTQVANVDMYDEVSASAYDELEVALREAEVWWNG